MNRSLVAPFLAASLALNAACSSAQQDPRWDIPPRPKEETDQLASFEELNRVFRDITYPRARSGATAQFKTVVIVRFSGATLFRNGEPVETKRVIPSAWHNLRYCAHVPFTICLELLPIGDVPLPDDSQKMLTAYRAALDRALADIPKLPMTDLQRERQRALLTRSTQVIDQVLRDKVAKPSLLREYAHSVSTAIRDNCRDAAIAQVDALHAQMVAWKRAVPPDEWSSLGIVLHGPQQQRCNYVVTQYFAALFQDQGDSRGYPGESHRVVYCEENALRQKAGAPPHPAWAQDLALLGAVNVDAACSEALFIDPDRLSFDIMGEGAKEYLRTFKFEGLR